MRILTFTSLFPNCQAPNYSIFLLQRISHFAKRGNEVEVVAPVPYVPRWLGPTSKGRVASLPARETIRGLPIYHPRYPLLPKVSMPFHGLLMYVGCYALARQLHRQNPFDCIDAHYVFPDGLAAVLIGKSLGIPVTLTARGSDIHTFTRFATIRPQIRWALRNADGKAAVSTSLAKIMDSLGPSLEKTTVIGNGVDTQRFFAEGRHSARTRLGLSQEEKVVVSVAALRHVKGCDLLLRAAALLRKSGHGCRVLFVGSGPELASLQRLARELGCADMVAFPGQVNNEELRHYYSAADVSCIPSRNEGWPNVLLESLACSTPVVATRVGAAAEILSDAALGILVDPTPESICDGLRQALDRTWHHDQLVAYASKHSWEDVAAQMQDFLEQSIDRRLSTAHCEATA
jgi:glycosyltransferase involved in cell wall biosynthesis